MRTRQVEETIRVVSGLSVNTHIREIIQFICIIYIVCNILEQIAKSDVRKSVDISETESAIDDKNFDDLN